MGAYGVKMNHASKSEVHWCGTCRLGITPGVWLDQLYSSCGFSSKVSNFI